MTLVAYLMQWRVNWRALGTYAWLGTKLVVYLAAAYVCSLLMVIAIDVASYTILGVVIILPNVYAPVEMMLAIVGGRQAWRELRGVA
jgi:hypothetical protein